MSYTVRSNDTLSGIAAQQRVSLRSLEQANPQLRNPDRLSVGQRLNLPGSRDTFEPAPRTTQTARRTTAEPTGASSQAAGASGSAAANSVPLAQRYLNRSESDLQRSGVTQRGVSLSHSCANFVTTMLQRSGAIDFHDNAVHQMSADLQAQGWHRVSTADARPGDVWVVDNPHGERHTELVASNQNGRVTLIGSNNHPDPSDQHITYDSRSAYMRGSYILSPR